MELARTCMPPLLAGAGVAAAAMLASCGDPGGVPELVVDSAVVSSEGVTPAEGRTYEYAFAEVRPDSTLRALWRDGIALQVAWRPLHYMCDDIRGARLTVQVVAPDPGMAAHDFTLGTGRLQCSPDLMRYVVSSNPG